VGFTVDPNLILGAQHDDVALEALLTVVWPEAYRVAFGVLHDHGMAEDAAQDACANIARGLPRLRSTNAFYTWMYRIIVRQATTSAKRWKKTADLDAVAGLSSVSTEDERLDLLDAVEALPVMQRAVIVLRYYVGLNSSEMAVVLGAPAVTVRFYLMLARRALRAALVVLDSRDPADLEACPHAQ
jgi:RNA polymerase sigma-70 factor (ECF subfamily)